MPWAVKLSMPGSRCEDPQGGLGGLGAAVVGGDWVAGSQQYALSRSALLPPLSPAAASVHNCLQPCAAVHKLFVLQAVLMECCSQQWGRMHCQQGLRNGPESVRQQRRCWTMLATLTHSPPCCSCMPACLPNQPTNHPPTNQTTTGHQERPRVCAPGAAGRC